MANGENAGCVGGVGGWLPGRVFATAGGVGGTGAPRNESLALGARLGLDAWDTESLASAALREIRRLEAEVVRLEALADAEVG